jgi:hypothetical protein
MSMKNITYTLPSALAGGGTIASIAYPTGTARGDYAYAGGHYIVTGTGDRFDCPKYYTITFSSTTFTINWTSGSPTLPAGTVLYIGLNQIGPNFMPSELRQNITMQQWMCDANVVRVKLGSPLTTAANDICAAQAISGTNVSATLNGTRVTSSVAYINDCNGGRYLRIVSSNVGDTTQTVTVRGYDCFGNKLSDRVTLNGTTKVNSNKAFYRVTAVIVSATMTGNLTVGAEDIYGLPFFLPDTGAVVKEINDGAAPSAGTFVAGLQSSAASITSADVRGKYTPATASDGSKSAELIVALPDPLYMGQDQYTDW